MDREQQVQFALETLGQLTRNWKNPMGLLKTWCGAKNFGVDGEDMSVTFTLPHRQIKKVKVKLDVVRDTYTITGGKLNTRTWDWVEKFRYEDVYSENLYDIFTSETGYALGF